MGELDLNTVSADGGDGCVGVVLEMLHLNVNAPDQVVHVLLVVLWLEHKAPVDLGQNQFAAKEKRFS